MRVATYVNALLQRVVVENCSLSLQVGEKTQNLFYSESLGEAYQVASNG